MKILDLLTMSVNNLRRRKLRTLLTVLGVVIGTASIVVMVSLGIGLKEMQMELVSSYGSMTAIDVYCDVYSQQNSSEEPNYMKDETVEMIRRMPHVKSVTPLLSSYVIMMQGKYMANVSLVGVTRGYLEGIPLGQGELPPRGSQEMFMVAGNWVPQNFQNPKENNYYMVMNGENPTLAPYAKEGECYMRVTAKAPTVEEADEMCRPLIEEIRRRVGDFVYSVDVESLEELVVGELAAQGKTLATAESCTGGLLSKRITDVAGASSVFHMGVVTYANQAKEDLLGVSHETLERWGAVSSQTAREMAQGIVRRSQADLGIGITGIAGPDGGTAEKPVGLIYIALSDGERTWVTKRHPIGRTKSRAWHRHCAASQALDMVRRYLEGLPVEADY